jgi:hypothetical protein
MERRAVQFSANRDRRCAELTIMTTFAATRDSCMVKRCAYETGSVGMTDAAILPCRNVRGRLAGR